MRRKASISVVSACYNCAEQLPALIESLRRQTDPDFEWVVADGASTDGTIDLLRAISDLDVKISSQPDFGIYDAINRAIRQSTGEYYVVAGADDRFNEDAIANFRKAIANMSADIIVAEVMFGEHRFSVKKWPSWVVGEKAFIANHSVSTAFRKSLHDKMGYYSRSFPIAADSLFVLQSCNGGATRGIAGFLAGYIGGTGVSYIDWAGSATELFRVQLRVGRAVFPQAILLLLRIVKGANSGARLIHERLFRG